MNVGIANGPCADVVSGSLLVDSSVSGYQLGDIPPAPPPGEIAQSHIASTNRCFEDEPEEPSFAANPSKDVLNAMPIEQLQAEITEIGNYLKSWPAFLAPIKEILEREKQLSTLVKSEADDLNQLSMQLAEKQKVIAACLQNDKVIKLKMQTNKTTSVEVPVFSDGYLTEVQADLKASGYVGSLRFMVKKSDVLTGARQAVEMLSSDLKHMQGCHMEHVEELDRLRKTEIRGVGFAQLTSLIMTKDGTIRKWKGALEIRKSQLSPPKPHIPESLLQARGQTRSLQSLLMNHPELVDKYPVLNEVAALETNQSVLIQMTSESWSQGPELGAE